MKNTEVAGKDLHIHFGFSGSHETCPECGQALRIHQWRDIRLLGPPTGLHERSFWHVRYCVYECPECRLFKTQDIPFRFLGTRCTTYMAKRICEDLDCQNETVRNVARRYRLKWDMVRNIHKAFLRAMERLVPEPEPPRIAVVDEFSVERNHRYATFVINGEDKYPLYLHRGNSADDFEPFFRRYGKGFYERIEAFAMDQNAGYASVVRRFLPACTVVSDYFHMVKNYNEDVIERIRARMIRAAKLRGDSRGAGRLRGSKRLLVKRLGKDDLDARLALQELMEENRELDTALHMRKLLQDLYDRCRDERLMLERWTEWCEMAKASCIPELMRFAEVKRRRTGEIIGHAKYAISSGVIEGCMNKIKVLKRVAFGFRDWNYFFLRVWQVFLPAQIKRRCSDMIWESVGLQDEGQEETA